MKKYIKPEIRETDDMFEDAILASGDLNEGENVWDNELPVIPLDNF